MYAVSDINGDLGIGGDFTVFSNGGGPANYIIYISAPYSASGSQFYFLYQGGTNDVVYAIHHASPLTFVGGNFSNVGVNTSPFSAFFCGYYDAGLASWSSVAGNQINNTVYTFQPTSYSQYLLTGAFTSVGGITTDYTVYLDVSSPNSFSSTTLSLGGLVPTYKQRFFNGSYNCVIGFDNTFYISNSYQVWSNLGQTGASNTITGINNWNGNWKVVGDSGNHVRSHATLPHSCEFQGSFVYDGTAYTKYTIVPRNVSQQFIGDDQNTYWSIIGAGVGSFS